MPDQPDELELDVARVRRSFGLTVVAGDPAERPKFQAGKIMVRGREIVAEVRRARLKKAA